MAVLTRLCLCYSLGMIRQAIIVFLLAPCLLYARGDKEFLTALSARCGGRPVSGAVNELDLTVYSTYNLSTRHRKEILENPEQYKGVDPKAKRVSAKATFNPNRKGIGLYDVEYETYDKEGIIPQEVREYLRFAMKRYVDSGVFSQEEAERYFVRMEEALDPARREYMIFKGKDGKFKGGIRVYHGSPYIDPIAKFPLPIEGDSYKLPMEREFPDLVLPERQAILKDGKYGINKRAFVVELGRMAGDKEMDEVQAAAYNRAASLMFYRYSEGGKYPNAPAIYGEVPQRGMEILTKVDPNNPQPITWKVIKTPADLKQKPGEPPKYILRAEMSTFNEVWGGGALKFPSFREPNSKPD